MYSLAINSAYPRNIGYLPSQLATRHFSNTTGTLTELYFKLGIKFVDAVLLPDEKHKSFTDYAISETKLKRILRSSGVSRRKRYNDLENCFASVNIKPAASTMNLNIFPPLMKSKPKHIFKIFVQTEFGIYLVLGTDQVSILYFLHNAL